MGTVGKSGSTLRTVPDANSAPYTVQVKPPKYNTFVALRRLEGGAARRYAPGYFRGWDSDDHLYAAVTHLERAAKHQEHQARLITRGETRYGSHGGLISGGFRPHWPEELKAEVRRESHAATAAMDAAVFHYGASGKRKSFVEWRQEIGAMW